MRAATTHEKRHRHKTGALGRCECRWLGPIRRRRASDVPDCAILLKATRLCRKAQWWSHPPNTTCSPTRSRPAFCTAHPLVWDSRRQYSGTLPAISPHSADSCRTETPGVEAGPPRSRSSSTRSTPPLPDPGTCPPCPRALHLFTQQHDMQQSLLFSRL